MRLDCQASMARPRRYLIPFLVEEIEEKFVGSLISLLNRYRNAVHSTIGETQSVVWSRLQHRLPSVLRRSRRRLGRFAGGGRNGG